MTTQAHSLAAGPPPAAGRPLTGKVAVGSSTRRFVLSAAVAAGRVNGRTHG
jgi:hypothetical protein